jgi:hypothetical protein
VFSPDGARVVRAGTARLCDAGTGAPRTALKGDTVWCCASERIRDGAALGRRERRAAGDAPRSTPAASCSRVGAINGSPTERV